MIRIIVPEMERNIRPAEMGESLAHADDIEQAEVLNKFASCAGIWTSHGRELQMMAIGKYLTPAAVAMLRSIVEGLP